jgi:hypothetical protein
MEDDVVSGVVGMAGQDLDVDPAIVGQLDQHVAKRCVAKRWFLVATGLSVKHDCSAERWVVRGREQAGVRFTGGKSTSANLLTGFSRVLSPSACLPGKTMMPHEGGMFSDSHGPAGCQVSQVSVLAAEVINH